MTANVRIMNSESEEIAKALTVIANELGMIRGMLYTMMIFDNNEKASKASLRIAGYIINTEDRE